MDVGSLSALQGLNAANEAIGSMASGLRANGVAVAKEREAASAASSSQSVADTVTLSSLAATAAQPSTTSSRSGPSNMLARNFASFTRETSKYIEASLNAFKINDMIADAAAQPASTLLDMAGGLFFAHEPSGFEDVEAGGNSKYVDAILKRLEVDRLAKSKKNRDTAEESEEVLEEARDDIEQAADEATAPKDADGNVISGVDADPTAQAVGDEGVPDADADGEGGASDVSHGVQDMQAKAEKAVAQAVQRAEELATGTSAADADAARDGSTAATVAAAGGYTRAAAPLSQQGAPLMDDAFAHAQPSPSVDIVV
jgi:hypothetical protein